MLGITSIIGTRLALGCAAALAGLLLGVAFGTEPTASADLSTPRKALTAVIEAEKRGDVTSLQAILSRERFKQFLKLADNWKRRPAEMVEPANPYESVEVLREDIAGDHAGLFVKAVYRKAWLEENKAEEEPVMTVREDGSQVSADGSTTMTIEKFEGAGLVRSLPCEKDGIGYVLYVFVKEDGQWRLWSGLTFKTIIDPQKFPPYVKFLKGNQEAQTH